MQLQICNYLTIPANTASEICNVQYPSYSYNGGDISTKAVPEVYVDVQLYKASHTMSFSSDKNAGLLQANSSKSVAVVEILCHRVSLFLPCTAAIQIVFPRRYQLN